VSKLRYYLLVALAIVAIALISVYAVPVALLSLISRDRRVGAGALIAAFLLAALRPSPIIQLLGPIVPLP